MTIVVGMRELARNSNILDGYDYVDVEDKKTHKYKGLFVSPKYADEFKRFLEDKIADNLQEQLNEIERFSGSIEIEERFVNLTDKEIREKIGQEKYGI